MKNDRHPRGLFDIPRLKGAAPSPHSSPADLEAWEKKAAEDRRRRCVALPLGRWAPRQARTVGDPRRRGRVDNCHPVARAQRDVSLIAWKRSPPRRAARRSAAARAAQFCADDASDHAHRSSRPGSGSARPRRGIAGSSCAAAPLPIMRTGSPVNRWPCSELREAHGRRRSFGWSRILAAAAVIVLLQSLRRSGRDRFWPPRRFARHRVW